MRRLAPIALALLMLGFAPVSATAASAPCSPRLLVLSAMPLELDPLLAQATGTRTEVVDGHRFFVGRLAGNDVVLAMTGIGTVNADRTTRAALGHFRCGSNPGISGVVFSGVSGGRTFIGDVTIASRWTLDGKSWIRADPRMFAVARRVARSGSVKLADRTPPGDPACVGIDPDLVSTVAVEHPPQILVGGEGESSDPFGGRRLPCMPYGGDVFGCEPCTGPSDQSSEVQPFIQDGLPFLDPQFFQDYNDWQSSDTSGYVAVDMETAAVAQDASDAGIPFIAFRALSDGKGDPLMLPGFPFQFFVYRQLAADNAAAVALAFLKAWAAPR